MRTAHASRAAGSDRGGAWPPGVLVADWIDLPAEVTRCALVVLHGGAGTSWAALSAGVPAVCLPQAGDQFRNAELLARAGAGLVVQPDNADADILRNALAHALDDSSMATAARHAQQHNAALPGPDELATRLARWCHARKSRSARAADRSQQKPSRASRPD